MRKVLLASVGAAALLVGSSSMAAADEYAAQNAAAFGGGNICTVDITTSTQVGCFVPDAATGSNNGRAVAILGSFIYYTELTGGFGPSDGIHIAKWNTGAGSHDIGFITNPTPGTGIVDVKGNGGFLYIMTGYPSGPEVIDKMDGVGHLLSTVALSPGLSNSDGFTILPNGNYLINAGDGVNSYNQYDPTTGALIAGTTIVNGGCGTSTGVDTDGVHLFFSCNLSSIEETDFSGNAIANFANPGGEWEDISLNQQAPINPPGVPEPITLSLVGAGLAGLRWARRRS